MKFRFLISMSVLAIVIAVLSLSPAAGQAPKKAAVPTKKAAAIPHTLSGTSAAPISRHRPADRQSGGGSSARPARVWPVPHARPRRGERTARSALSRLRHPSRGEISHGRSLAARAGNSAQTSRRTASPPRLVDVMRRRPVGDRRHHRSGRDMVRTLNSNS